MKVWLLTAITAVCFLKATSLQCSNDPCTATDYISYASCLSHQCPNTVVATGCTESKCSSTDCNTCSSFSSCCRSCCRSKCECSSFKCHTCSSSSSSACCQTCCRSKCECSSFKCNTCSSSRSSSCCQTCCSKQDCCTSTKREECCHTHPQQICCKDKPVQPAIPSFTLPNITIVINQSAPIIYNTLNQSCGGVKTTRNSTHIVTTTGTCEIDRGKREPCCIITHQPHCPRPLPIHHHCPPPVQNYACGAQCIVQSQAMIQPPPPPPVVIQPPPRIVQSVIQPPPQIIQPPPPPPVMVQQQSLALCYLYPVHQCPQHCHGLCHWSGNSGCSPTQQWPFIRCGYGGQYSGGIGGIGVYGGYGGYGGPGGYISQGGYGGFIGQGGYGGYGAGAQPIAG